MMPPIAKSPLAMETSSTSSASSASAVASANESFVILANGTKGAAAVGLLRQVLESPNVFVFGELLAHPNIAALDKSQDTEETKKYFNLLNLFAYGTYSQYLSEASLYPSLTPPMLRKLRLLTLATLATRDRILKYKDLQEELKIDSVRDLEELIISGTYANVVQGKLDQKSGHFEVDFTMARDIKQSEIKNIVGTLEEWCKGCDGMLTCLENEADRANKTKSDHIAHKAALERKAADIRGKISNQPSTSDCGGPDDPDSRMELDPRSSSRDHKKGGPKAKGLRGSGNKGGGTGGTGGTGGGFWQK